MPVGRGADPTAIGFLNPERVSPPAIDLDFDERRRGEVMEYTVNKWGAANIAQVITFGTIKTKAAIKDAARGLEGLVRNAGVHACAVIMSSEPPGRVPAVDAR